MLDDNDIELLDQSSDEETTASTESQDLEKKEYALIHFIYLFILKLQLTFRLSEEVVVFILKLIKVIFVFLSISIPHQLIASINSSFPSSSYLLRKYANMSRASETYKIYVACPLCDRLYDPSIFKLTELDCGVEVSVKCSYVAYPHHSQISRRKTCGELLMRKVKCKGGKYSFRPKRTFCFYGVIKGLTHLVRKPMFWDACNEWRYIGEHFVLSDIYDGRVWKEFVDKGFFNDCCSLALMLNVDWFQPFKHTTYSLGVMYLTILNLPGRVRYKLENSIIVGIIPGPHEPKGTMNTFLGPMVEDLLQLWHGCWFEDSSGNKKFVKAVLLAVVCDTPATRKVGGFVGHSALRGCSKCTKQFVTKNFGEKADYSGFDVDSWPLRTDAEQRRHGYKYLSASTLSCRKQLDRKYGARYTVLLELPYYDSVHFVLIDPMHSLFLGIAKHVYKVWYENDIITDAHKIVIQNKVDALITPPSIGRIPLKLGSGFASLTADQWNNWVCIYSSHALYGILPVQDWECWQLFVKAVKLFCIKNISHQQCKAAHDNLVEFCELFTQLYGKEKLVINMHLSCHLQECIMDYGPVYAFWCFGFERFNGILGSYPSNNCNVAITMMKKFHEEVSIDCCDVDPIFQTLFSELDRNAHLVGSLQLTTAAITLPLDSLVSPVPSPACLAQNIEKHNHIFGLLKPLYEHILPPHLVVHLSAMYSTIYGTTVGTISQICTRSSKLEWNGISLCSQLSRTERGNHIAAYWAPDVHRDVIVTDTDRPHLGQVMFYFQHAVELKNETRSSQLVKHIIAFVSWFECHADRDILGPPMEIWHSQFMPVGMYSFIPAVRILYPVAFCRQKVETCYGEEDVCVSIPLNNCF